MCISLRQEYNWLGQLVPLLSDGACPLVDPKLDAAPRYILNSPQCIFFFLSQEFYTKKDVHIRYFFKNWEI